MRTAILVVAVAFIGGLLALTVHAVVQGGPDILTILSALVLATLLLGVVGALLHPPEE
jgi:hypothetical protein